MKKQRGSTQASKGFTLIEMLVTVAVYGLLMVVAANLLVIVFKNANTNPNALNSIDQAQAAAANFVNLVRDAAYGNDGSYPLGEASTTEVIFFSPYGTGSSATVDRIRYYISGSTLYEGITAPSGSPSSYNLANEKVSSVVAGVSGIGTSTIFYYFTGTYGGTSTPLSQPVNVNQVTYITMNFSVNLDEVRGSSATSSISTGAAIRNLKTNLGN